MRNINLPTSPCSLDDCSWICREVQGVCGTKKLKQNTVMKIPPISSISLFLWVILSFLMFPRMGYKEGKPNLEREKRSRHKAQKCRVPKHVITNEKKKP